MGRARFLIYPWFIFIFSRAAMGRARFLIYTWFIFIFNRAAMGRARFLIYTWFIFIFNRAAIGRARFLIYSWFIIIFFVMSVSWTKLLSAGMRMTQLMMFRVKKISDYKAHALQKKIPSKLGLTSKPYITLALIIIISSLTIQFHHIKILT